MQNETVELLLVNTESSQENIWSLHRLYTQNWMALNLCKNQRLHFFRSSSAVSPMKQTTHSAVGIQFGWDRQTIRLELWPGKVLESGHLQVSTKIGGKY
jgi:UV DNA damage repair endonuclease